MAELVLGYFKGINVMPKPMNKRHFQKFASFSLCFEMPKNAELKYCKTKFLS